MIVCKNPDLVLAKFLIESVNLRNDRVLEHGDLLISMKKYNPVFIPRNHLVDEAIKKAVVGDMSSFNKLLEILKKPYKNIYGLEEFMQPPSPNFEKCFQTYCGT